MTSNQRRPGFRLPWASETDEATAQSTEAVETPSAPVATAASAGAAETAGAAEAESASKATASAEPVAQAEPSTPAEAAADVTPGATAPAPAVPPAAPSASPAVETSAGFMRDLVEAMRRVAEETRQSGLSDLRTKAEEQVRSLESDADHRREELTARAETDVAGVGKWAEAETERIKKEAEQRVVARRAQLDQQLAAETTRSEAEAKSLRDRVAEYERELDAYHAQLSDIADPAAFAAAAKRMPAPPRLAGGTAETAPSPDASASPSVPGPEVHPAEEEVLTARLAELDAALEPSDSSEPASAVGDAPVAPASSAEPTSTEILVKGLGSFGAITGFRQSLASVEGIEGVSLSLGPTGEFVFRAIHPTGFDVSAAIAGLEGDAATVEPQADGGLRVTLDRAR
ncbi:MAG: hypothetical protein ACT4OQ_09895 [Chloroflexota bacterium]